MDDRLEDPSRQNRALWELVEEVVRLPKLSVLCQPHLLHHSPIDLNGFEADHRFVAVVQIHGGVHNDNAMREIVEFTVPRERFNEGRQLEATELRHRIGVLFPRLGKFEDAVVNVAGG